MIGFGVGSSVPVLASVTADNELNGIALQMTPSPVPVPAPVIPSSDTNVNHIERRRNNMQDIIDQLAVIRVQLDELEKEIRGMMTPKEEEKPPVTMADVRRLMAEKWNLGKRDEVRSLLAAYGAQKLTDVSPGHYEELAEKIEAL